MTNTKLLNQLNIVGSTISSKEAEETLSFIRLAKDKAKEHIWIYHCTTIDSFLSIIKNREMWLSNLQEVNDEEEVGRIDKPEFEKSYYVACFTYDPKISDSHWEEYGKTENSILFGIKQDWFIKDMHFLNSDNCAVSDDCYKICDSMKMAYDYTIEEFRKNRIYIMPYYMMDFGFYQVIYDDYMKKKTNCSCSMTSEYSDVEIGGEIFIPNIHGIIKSTHGICKRADGSTHEKKWTDEKEVRLKVCVKTNFKDINDSGLFFRRLSVSLDKNAFDVLPVRFNINISKVKKDAYMDQIRLWLPNSVIYEI